MARQLTEADVISLAVAVAGEGGGGGTGDGDMKKAVYDSDLSVANAGGIKSFVNSSISNKVDKVTGKGLSTNDYTDADAEKLSALVEVEANPSDSASETLTKIKVDDTIYSVPNGGGGTSDYTELSNKPQINSHTLSGNQSGSDLGLVNSVSGKGLSENDYTNADKAIVDGVTTALSNKVDKVSGKGLSTNDYDNTAKGIVDGVTTALAGKVDTSSVGANSGIAQLDATGKVPSSQLPSYVDDVLEYNSQSAFPATGEEGKIYIAKDTNKTYRWSGSTYVEISESLALGETSSTAYAGNKGKANADNISTIQGLIPSSATTSNKLATASDLQSKANISQLDGWSSQSQVSSGSITFTGIDDTNNNGYELFINVTASSTQKNPSSQIESISGTGTSSMSITFSTDADEGAYGKLRIIR